MIQSGEARAARHAHAETFIGSFLDLGQGRQPAIHCPQVMKRGRRALRFRCAGNDPPRRTLTG